MKEYIRAFQEFLSHPIDVITNGNFFIIFIIVEVLTLAFVMLVYRKYGKIFGVSKLFWVISLAIIIGYVIHFIIMVILIGNFYNSTVMP